MLVRLQKFLADAGVASRRASEEIILSGAVQVNGRIVRELGSKVDPQHDRVTVSGSPVRTKKKLYVALHKPAGCICSRKDPAERRTVFDLIPKEWGTLHTVGRLDFKSEGLLFLTNDGEFSLKLTHPRYGVPKIYVATIEGRVELEALRNLTKGIYDAGELLRAEKVRVASSSNSRTVIELVLRQGKNREVRRMFEIQGHTVERLQRLQIGPIKLGELPSGRWRTLTESEIKSLLLQAGSETGAGKARSQKRNPKPDV